MIKGITEEQLLQARMKIGEQLAGLIEENGIRLPIEKKYVDDMKKGTLNFDINKLLLLSGILGFEIVLRKTT